MEFSLEPLTLTKELILSRIPEEKIMEHYGIPIQKGLFKSPLRKDANPTCSVTRNKKGRLIMKDWSGAFSGDCFAVVMEKFQCSYYMALQIIANDFGIISRPDLNKNKPKIKYTGAKVEEHTPSNIQIQTREFNQAELNWWLSYGINKGTLKKFRVYPVDAVWINGNLFFTNIDSKPVFAYFGGIKDGIEKWRVYFTGRKKYKFISNWKANEIQGAHMVPKDGGDFIVVTKSMKDVMELYEFGIPAIAPCSENLFVTDSQYNRLKEKFKHIICFYDNDWAGKRAMVKIRNQYPDVICVMLNKNDAKDISDYRKKFGYQKTRDLIEKTKSDLYAKEGKNDRGTS